MKPIQSAIIAAAALLGYVSAQTATTVPVGYVTEVLRPSRYNLVGLNLQLPVVASGVFSAKSGNSLTASGITFDSSLSLGKTYILEFEDGTYQEVTAWQGSVLTTPDDISALVTVNVTKFKLRPAATVTDVFGAQNTIGLTPSTDGTVDACDTVIIPTTSGLQTIYFFNDGEPVPTTGWYTEQGDPAEDILIPYVDAMFVNRVAGSDLNLVVTGELKTTPTARALPSGFSYLSSVAPPTGSVETPTGLTLATSGLNTYLAPSVDGTLDACDTVYLAKEDGSYTACYFFNDGEPVPTTGWYTEQGDPADSLPLTSGLIIQNNGVEKPFKLNVPSSYSTL